MITNKLNPVVLFRASLAEEKELEVCKKYFRVITQRSQVKCDDLVIPRYSALPWYKEFEEDVTILGGKIINSYSQHLFVADLGNWYHELEEYTPKTWFYLDQLPEAGPFVLKGQTNSKKHNWNTHMFAKNKKEAIEVFGRLTNDSYINTQQILARKFIKLRSFGEAVQGLPITEEYRFFILDGQIMSGAFYWSEHTEYIIEHFDFIPSADFVPKDLLQKIINIVSPSIRFFVIDVARTETGEWILIELNDAQMSGLSDNDPEILYSNMAKVLI